MFLKQFTAIILFITITGCAGINIINQPKTNNIDLRLISITPDTLFFQGQVKLKNINPISIPLKKLKLSLVFNEKLTIIKVINDLPLLTGYDSKIIKFTFKIPRNDLISLSSNELFISCTGTIVVKNKHLHEPISFFHTSSFVLPKNPIIKLKKYLISKNQKQLSMALTLLNENDFPITVQSIKGHIDYKKYSYTIMPFPSTIEIQESKKINLSIIANKHSIISSIIKPKLFADLIISTPMGQMIIPLNKLNQIK